MCDIVMRTEESKKGLIELAIFLRNELKNGKMAEIGSFKGDSTVIFAKYAKFSEIFAIDPFKNNIGDITDTVNMADVKKHFKKSIKNYENIAHIEELSVKAAEQFENESLDFVYIDANHDYEPFKKDLKAWLPKVKKGGYIGGHDYRSRFKGVIQAVHEIVGPPEKTYKDTSWLVKVV